MKKNVIFSVLLITVLSLVFTGCEYDSTNDTNTTSANDTNTTSVNDTNITSVMKVALLGGEPIWKGQDKNATIDSINAHNVDFTLFNGDTKDGSSECSDYAIGKHVINYFSRLNNSVSYSVGDNDWTDCHRTSNGSYDPIERLSYIRNTFFNKSTTQGNNPFTVERQGVLGKEYSENSRFIKGNVMFIVLHIPGSNNNFVPTPDDKFCTKKSTRGATECNAATAEYIARNAKNLEWLTSSFAKAKEQNTVGVVVSMQADIYFPFELSDGGYVETFLPQLDPATNGYADFFHELITLTHNYSGQVVLYHSDSHYFKMDKAMWNDDNKTITSNFTRIEGFGDAETSWVEMTIDPKSKEVFSFKPIILPALQSSK